MMAEKKDIEAENRALEHALDIGAEDDDGRRTATHGRTGNADLQPTKSTICVS